LDSKYLSWDDFSNYLISKASSTGGIGDGIKGGKSAMSSLADNSGSS
jgi:hypothetical protein